MKKLIHLFAIVLLLFSCASDDESIDENQSDDEVTLNITVVEVTDHEAMLNWELSKQESETVYRILLNGEVIRENYGAKQIVFTELIENREYVGTIFAIRQNSTQVFARFEFNTLNDVNEEGSLSLNSQEEIDNLIIETVGRTLSIGGSDITNLDGLSRLRT
ncbi:MAG: hypothetical protein KTR22_14160, partial [Flavobacteriaceae bacterium]|nr:hypothetical protein [Flavobacteriaceae bacterium]